METRERINSISQNSTVATYHPSDPHLEDRTIDARWPASLRLHAPARGASPSPAWVVHVLRHCSFSASASAESWPAVISTKGLIKDWVQKGQAAKERDATTDIWYYALNFDKYQMRGTEGREIRHCQLATRIFDLSEENILE